MNRLRLFAGLFGLLSLFTTGVSAAEYCWTEYLGCYYFVPGRETIHCGTGDRFVVRSETCSEGSAELRERTRAFMKELGYELLFPNRDGYSGTPDDIYVRNFRVFSRYCRLLEKDLNGKGNSVYTLTCPNSAGSLSEGSGVTLSTDRLANIEVFLRAKGFVKIDTVPTPPKPLHPLSWRYPESYRSLSFFGSDGDSELCDTKVPGMIAPFTLNCAQ